MNQLYFNLKKSYEITAFMAKEMCDCLLHFAGRKSGFRDAGNLCWESPGHTASSGAAALTPLLRSLFTMRHNLMYFLRFPSHILKAKSPFASENNSSEVSSAVPHPTLLTICKQLASGFLIKKGWLTPSITIPTKLESKHTHTQRSRNGTQGDFQQEPGEWIWGEYREFFKMLELVCTLVRILHQEGRGRCCRMEKIWLRV